MYLKMFTSKKYQQNMQNIKNNSEKGRKRLQTCDKKKT